LQIDFCLETRDVCPEYQGWNRSFPQDRNEVGR
jgi:hypothetical protein